MKLNFHTQHTEVDRTVKLLTQALLLWVVFTGPVSFVFALDGNIGTHDPTTIMVCDGKYYAYGTGGNTHVSSDGWTWDRGASVPGGGGMGPDMIHIGDNYFMYVASNVGGQPASRIVMKTTKSLNPESPDYGWTEVGVVNTTDGVEFCNGIDPGCFLDPTTGRFWLTFGSYFGNIRVVELDPKTGMRVDDTYHNVAINCEASTMIYHEGYYYLLATHGSCCQGSNSGYNIRTGRSKSVTGPFIDHEGIDMMQGGGKLVIGSGERYIGAGHFGLIDEGQGVQKFSLHWEADLQRGGGSVLDIRPLLWEDGWPVAGEKFKEGTYQVLSYRSGTALELAVEGQAVGRSSGGARGGAGAARGGGGMMGGRGAGGVPVADQTAADVMESWPAGNIDARLSNYMCQAQQKWTITPAEGKGGYLGAPYYKIQIAGTDRVLAAAEGAEVVTVPSYTGSDEQLWRIELLTDGKWRIMPKAIPGTNEPMALSAIGASSVTLAKFDPDGLKQRWLFKAP